jgi:hypothetical protein
VHFGDAQPIGDLGLGEVAPEAQGEDPLVAFGQVLQMGVDRFYVHGMSTALSSSPSRSASSSP